MHSQLKHVKAMRPSQGSQMIAEWVASFYVSKWTRVPSPRSIQQQNSASEIGNGTASTAVSTG